MYRDINVLRMVPDRVGRGGLKFGYHAFQQEPINDTRETTNVYIWQGSWMSDPAISEYTNYYPDQELADAGDKKALSLHGYSKFSLTDPTDGPNSEMLGHNVRVWGVNTYGYIFNYTRVVDMVFEPPNDWINSNIICYASTTHPAVFCNVNNRCFIATGINEAVISDSSTGPDVNPPSHGTPKAYSLGVGQPLAAPVIESTDVTAQSSGWVRDTSAYITNPDPNSALKNAQPLTVPPDVADSIVLVADGVTWTGATGIDIASGTDTFVTTGIYVSLPNGSDIATFSGAAIPTGNGWAMLTITIGGLVFRMTAFGNATPAEPSIVPALGLLDCKLDGIYRGPKLRDPDTGLNLGWDPAYDIIDSEFTVTGYRWTMKHGGVDKPWVSSAGVTKDHNVEAQLTTTGGALTWDTVPPSYAYAWYDPISGHVSNISPVFSPAVYSQTERGIKIRVDVGSVSYPPSTTLVPRSGYNSRWTHILWFRTLMAGGSTLYPIGSLDPTSTEWRGMPSTQVPVIPPPGTGNYWYDNNLDSSLLVSGALRAPQFTNGRPRIIQNGVEQIISPSHLAYWDGRIWLAGPQDPAAIHYSCDRVQCPFGIPEESFSDTNVLRIPASDGCIRGMKLIGESLLITTERWAYTIAGNNEANYRLLRVSTRMAGVGEYQMAEFVSEVEGQRVSGHSTHLAQML